MICLLPGNGWGSWFLNILKLAYFINKVGKRKLRTTKLFTEFAIYLEKIWM